MAAEGGLADDDEALPGDEQVFTAGAGVAEALAHLEAGHPLPEPPVPSHALPSPPPAPPAPLPPLPPLRAGTGRMRHTLDAQFCRPVLRHRSADGPTADLAAVIDTQFSREVSQLEVAMGRQPRHSLLVPLRAERTRMHMWTGFCPGGSGLPTKRGQMRRSGGVRPTKRGQMRRGVEGCVARRPGGGLRTRRPSRRACRSTWTATSPSSCPAPSRRCPPAACARWTQVRRRPRPRRRPRAPRIHDPPLHPCALMSWHSNKKLLPTVSRPKRRGMPLRH